MSKKKQPAPPKMTHKPREGGTRVIDNEIKPKPASETTNETDKA
ncbi:hypothetical protein [Marinomonas shanghaiensis]|nr:hypothetical protein [Marinomonas shanghaiensis]